MKVGVYVVTAYQKAVFLVRQTLILSVVFKKHTELQYDPNLYRKSNVYWIRSFNTKLAQKYYCFLRGCDKVNTFLGINSTLKSTCRLTFSKRLKSLDYEAAESLLVRMRLPAWHTFITHTYTQNTHKHTHTRIHTHANIHTRKHTHTHKSARARPIHTHKNDSKICILRLP